ncbi:MAG: ATP-binding protein [Chitinophagaceae bacterium]|nr:ATP-binding protein [Chitinophagaceae bacterium]
MYLDRRLIDQINESLEHVPVTAVLGARQVGKSTLVKHILSSKDSMYLDLERPSDLNKLEDAELFFSSQKDKLICIDEVQRKPEIFPLIRSLVDERNRNGCFLILGSASRDLLNQSSETLAGRISYKKLTPFLWSEIKDRFTIEAYFSRGGFPRSLLAKKDETSYNWREDFITTFLERDLLQWRNFIPVTMRRLWQMLAHNNGQTADYSTLAKSLSISSVTIKNYIDLLEETFMLKTVPPYTSNLGKRLVKSPKIYLSDTGITATLLGLRNYEAIIGHSAFGSLWEQMVLNNLIGHFPNAEFYFYRTTGGAEIDFMMTLYGKVYAIECKASLSPKLSVGNFNAIEDISPTQTFVVVPANDSESWAMKNGIEVVSLTGLIAKIEHFI